MRIVRKSYLAVLLAALVVVTLSACGGGASDNGGGATSPPVNQGGAVSGDSGAANAHPDTQQAAAAEYIMFLTAEDGVREMPIGAVGIRKMGASSISPLLLFEDGGLWAQSMEGGFILIMENVKDFSGASPFDWSGMVLTTDGNLWSWGSFMNPSTRLPQTLFGFVGTDSMMDRAFHVKRDVSAIALGGIHAMVIDSDGVLWGSGSNTSGRLGDGTFETRDEATRIMDNVKAVFTSIARTYAITGDGVLWGWGSNAGGFLGVGATPERNVDDFRLTPERIMDDVVYVSLGRDASTMFAMTSDGALWGWGTNGEGALGIAEMTGSNEPVKIMENVATVSTSGNHTMAIDNNGTLWGWGRRYLLGVEHGTDGRSPVRIMDNVVAVSTDGIGTLVLTGNGELLTWERNSPTPIWGN